MITAKIIPAFYIIEVDGEAVNALFPGDYGISKIVIGSGEYQTDIIAVNAGEKIIELITENYTTTSELKEFNPEFFPSMPRVSGEVAEDRLREEIEQQEAALGGSDNAKYVPIILTKYFDELGDFVEAKHTIVGDDFSAVAKIAITPQNYLLEKKVLEEATRGSGYYDGRQAKTHIH